MTGQSFLPLLTNADKQIHEQDEVFATELFGRRAVRAGNWKLIWEELPWGKAQWELFNLKDDPGETQDLSLDEPEVKTQLINAWQVYSREVGVIIPDKLTGY
jgi:arylsulfatase A-like enzyme